MRIVIYPEASQFSNFGGSLCSDCVHCENEECSLDFNDAINDYTGVRECSEYTDEGESGE